MRRREKNEEKPAEPARARRFTIELLTVFVEVEHGPWQKGYPPDVAPMK